MGFPPDAVIISHTYPTQRSEIVGKAAVSFGKISFGNFQVTSVFASGDQVMNDRDQNAPTMESHEELHPSFDMHTVSFQAHQMGCGQNNHCAHLTCKFA